MLTRCISRRSMPGCHLPSPNIRIGRRRMPQRVVSVSAESTKSYAEAILVAKKSQDWVKVLEVLAVAKATNVQLPRASLELGIQMLAQGGQWQRAVDMLEDLRADNSEKPAVETVTAVLEALARGQQGERAHQLLMEVAGTASYGGMLSHAFNMVTRTLARQGHLNKALLTLNSMVASEVIVVQHETFTVVANEFIKAGDMDSAEEVLEMRDYL